MDLAFWVTVIAVLALVWCALVIVLVIVGRAVLARELAALVPNLVRLFAGLMRDRRVGLAPKVALGLGSLWLASPVDLIPDFIPLIGSLDDAIVAALVLRFVFATTDPAIVREHWQGDPRTLERITRLVLLGRGNRPPALP